VARTFGDGVFSGQAVARAGSSSLRGREVSSRRAGWAQGAWWRRRTPPESSSELEGRCPIFASAFPQSSESGVGGARHLFGEAERSR